MEKQVLSIEQMQELIELGIDTSNASMVWVINNSKLSDWKSTLETNEDIESWTSLGLSAIPTFTLQDILDKIFKFTLSKVTRDVYTCHTYVNGLVEHKTNGKSALEAAFNMLKWCKENKYI